MAIRPPDFITFTGVDDQTPVAGMRALAGRYPIEWGVLLDPEKQGLDPRFPALDRLAEFAASRLRLAAHLCGGHTDAIAGGSALAVPVDLRRFARTQINSHAVGVAAAAALGRETGSRSILPCRGPAFPDDDAVDWLHDLSGGRGLETRLWPRHPGRLAGYAGGIGPDTVAAVLAAIDADGPYWIDMETKIRSGDRFDLDLCERVCRAVYGARGPN